MGSGAPAPVYFLRLSVLCLFFIPAHQLDKFARKSEDSLHVHAFLDDYHLGIYSGSDSLFWLLWIPYHGDDHFDLISLSDKKSTGVRAIPDFCLYI